MKFDIPREWTKKFAWWPVATNKGRNGPQVVWLETIYYKVGTHGNAISYISKDDYEWAEEQYKRFMEDTQRFGDDPYRTTEEI